MHISTDNNIEPKLWEFPLSMKRRCEKTKLRHRVTAVTTTSKTLKAVISKINIRVVNKSY
jgi:hypothetical protein